ncbi:MAG: hypothetical protein P4L86_08885, partial [Mycobacterium sp.]|nr:hypothetical protein [Mycobacterium sp.]
MTANRVSRRAALTALPLCLPAVLTACGGTPVPTSFAPLSWDYLPRLRLNVASIDIDDSWTPDPGSRDQGFLAPTPPVAALRQMAQDRLVAAGTSGRATFVIDDASVVQSRDKYAGTFAAHLDISTSDGTRSGYTEARVLRTRNIDDDSPAGKRAELYGLIKQMMSDMNVEVEYQIRRSLHDYRLTGAPAAPGPGPVQQQDLAPPTPVLAPP